MRPSKENSQNNTDTPAIKKDKIKRTTSKRQAKIVDDKGQHIKLTQKDNSSIISNSSDESYSHGRISGHESKTHLKQNSRSFSSTMAHFLKEIAMKKTFRTRLGLALASLLAAASIIACGGGGDSGPTNPNPPVQTTFTAAANYSGCWDGKTYSATATSTVSQAAAQADADAAAKAQCPTQPTNSNTIAEAVKKINPMGTKVYHLASDVPAKPDAPVVVHKDDGKVPTTLVYLGTYKPDGSVNQEWLDKVIDGTIQCNRTQVVIDNRPIVNCAYRSRSSYASTNTTYFYCVQALYGDTLSTIKKSEQPIANTCSTNRNIYTMGNPTGSLVSIADWGYYQFTVSDQYGNISVANSTGTP